jgi:peptide/nickel transport system substrate-binding protein
MNDVLREGFDYRFSRLDPTAPHIDPPSVAIYEPLLVKGPDWRPYPLLATDWTTSSDGLEWRFQLRPALRFHSGAPCDSEAVIAAYELLRWGMVDEGQLWYWDPVDSVTSEGADTLVVRLHYPYARLPSLLWGTHTAVHNETMRAADPERFGHKVADGTGPYRLVSWSEEHVVAERWDDYLPPLAPFLAKSGQPPLRIEWFAIFDPDDRLAALESGDVHSIHGPPLKEVERLVAEDTYAVIEFPQQSNAYLAVDFRRHELLFDERDLRRALSLAIDRAALVRDVLHGHGSASYGAIPPGDEHYDPKVDEAGRYDRAESNRILDQFGFSRGDDGVRVRDGDRLTFRCVCQDDAVLLPLAQAVRAQLAEIGVLLELDPIAPFAPFYAAAAADPPCVMSKWLWPDPVDALIGFTATRAIPSDNWQRASSADLDAAFEEWLRADENGLMAAASRVQSTVARDLPYIPLVVPNDVWVHDRKLSGYQPYNANLYPLYQPVRLARANG